MTAGEPYFLDVGLFLGVVSIQLLILVFFLLLVATLTLDKHSGTFLLSPQTECQFLISGPIPEICLEVGSAFIEGDLR